jgi:predicted O-methyltransferase YrrM
VDNDDRLAAYAQGFLEPEDEPLRAARARSEEADIPAVPPETGALLRFLARVTRARHVVEVGSGGGYSGLWLLGGMDPRGSLTTIDIAPAHQSLAQQAYAEAGLTGRVRSILGPALSVLPKLADQTYDIVFLDAVKAEYPEYLAHAKRLLKAGGLLVADNVLWHGKVVDSEAVDEDTEAIRRFNLSVHDDPELQGLLLEIGDGVLCAVHQPTSGSP